MPNSLSNKLDAESHTPPSLLQPFSVIPTSHPSQALCPTSSPLIPGHTLGFKPHVVRADCTILQGRQTALPPLNKPELQLASTVLGAPALN